MMILVANGLLAYYQHYSYSISGRVLRFYAKCVMMEKEKLNLYCWLRPNVCFEINFSPSTQHVVNMHSKNSEVQNDDRWSLDLLNFQKTWKGLEKVCITCHSRPRFKQSLLNGSAPQNRDRRVDLVCQIYFLTAISVSVFMIRLNRLPNNIGSLAQNRIDKWRRANANGR